MSHKGYIQTEEHKRKRMESQKKFFILHSDFRKGKNHPLWGKKHSIESKLKMSLSQKNRLGIVEHMRKIRFDRTGLKHTEETIQKFRTIHLGNKSHLWKGGKTEFKCVICGKIFYRWKRNSKYNFCSRECSFKKTKEMSPNWKGGLTDDKEHMKKIMKVCRQRRTARMEIAGELPIKRIQQVYEDNIKKYGTLTCYLCLKPIEFGDDCLEHKTPISRGGTNEYSNLEIAHMRCNSIKKSKTVEEYMEYLKMEAL